MSTGTAVLADDLGPRGRQRVLVASIIATIGILALVAVAGSRLYDKGQFDRDLWEPLTQRSVQKFLLGGLVNTLKAASVAMVLSIVVGIVLALGRLAQNKPVRWVAGVYVEFFRAVPLLLLILFSALALPRYGLDTSIFWYLVFGLTLYNSAMLAEVFRAGILSLDRGQQEAATSLGMTYWQSMGYIVIPQAARRMIPSIVSQLVTLLKDTALGYVIAFEELLRRGRSTSEYFLNSLQTFTVIAALYFIVNFTISRIARRLEVRQRHVKKAAALKEPVATDILAAE